MTQAVTNTSATDDLRFATPDIRSPSARSSLHDRPAQGDRHTTAKRTIHEAGIGAAGYAFTRSPDAADLSMAAMTSWRRTASAKSGTVWVPLSMSAANAA